MLDAASAYLNLIHPNTNKKQKAREATDTLLATQRKANLSITLKALIMEYHVCDFNKKWGTGDKEESFIEQGHQIRARESSRYTRLTNFLK